MAALLKKGIYGTALERWEQNVVLPSTSSTHCLYVLSLACRAGGNAAKAWRMRTEKDTSANMLQALNSYWAQADAIAGNAGPAVFVTMSRMHVVPPLFLPGPTVRPEPSLVKRLADC